MIVGDDAPARTLERVWTSRGELALRDVGGRLEIISNGVFLMDTSDGVSERLLVDAAVARCTAPAPRLIIGGLGVGFTLARAVTHAHLAGIDVVEIETAVIDWHARYLCGRTDETTGDPRVRVIEADIMVYLQFTDELYDAICLDTDNGPNWLVFDSNARLYDQTGIDIVHRRLRPGGVLTVWSASRDPGYEDRLRTLFGDVETLETVRDRGVPDVVYVARRAT